MAVKTIKRAVENTLSHVMAFGGELSDKKFNLKMISQKVSNGAYVISCEINENMVAMVVIDEYKIIQKTGDKNILKLMVEDIKDEMNFKKQMQF